ncbi:MAG: hypothetical protein JRH13_14725 [Deltaproteobacteria bacterium]|nr:hypothetical protein [Deltaproteobacteria bacterium]
MGRFSEVPKRLVIFSIISTGISSITVQLVTVREFLTQFHGNEITISLVLSSWLLLGSLGSLLARPIKRASLTLFAALSLLAGFWPLVQLLLIRRFREVLFLHGISVGFQDLFLFILGTMAPYCLLAGFILPYALLSLKERKVPWTAGKLYLVDNIGDVLGGVFFSFLLVSWLKPFKTVAVTSSLLILAALLVFFFSRRYFLLALGLLSTLLFFLFSLDGGFEVRTLSRQYGDILRYLESPYGRVVITKEGPQHTFWESGLPLYSDGDIVRSEEKIHYPLSQLDKVERVLLVSGGLGETLGEVRKYNPREIDYVELDPLLTGVARDLGILPDIPGLRVLNDDGRRFIRKVRNPYDAIVIDLPDPDTFQINRFFTDEFFYLARRALTPQGILSFRLSFSANYLSPTRKAKLSAVLSTARRHFRNVLVIPGEKAVFLCRNGPLWTDIPSRLDAKGIKTLYVRGFYLGNATPERIRYINENLDATAEINRDFHPRIMGIVFREWLEKQGVALRSLVLLFSLPAVLYLFFLRKREEYVLFSTGLAAMGVEMICIMGFQAAYGYVYLKIGILVTAFLVGLLPGALLGIRRKKDFLPSLFFSDLLLLILLGVCLIWVRFSRITPPEILFPAFAFLFALCCGYQFPVASGLIGEERSPAAGCLAADLAGAAFGTLLTGAVLIPFWGFQEAIIALILVKTSSNMWVFFGLKR